MGNATPALVDKKFASISQTNKTLQDGCQSCAQQKLHDTRNREDTKGIQVLFLCTTKRVVFIVDISNIGILITTWNGDRKIM